jgi:hypothetical protein
MTQLVSVIENFEFVYLVPEVLVIRKLNLNILSRDLFFQEPDTTSYVSDNIKVTRLR